MMLFVRGIAEGGSANKLTFSPSRRNQAGGMRNEAARVNVSRLVSRLGDDDDNASYWMSCIVSLPGWNRVTSAQRPDARPAERIAPSNEEAH